MFFDDILLYSKREGEHEVHLRYVFEKLRQHKLYAKKSKSTFYVKQVVYLGYVISTEGVKPDPEKVKIVKEWPIPKSIKHSKKKKPFIWNDECQQSFEMLKEALALATVLKLPEFFKPFEVVTDASGRAIGAILLQERRPITYMSHKLKHMR